MTDKPGCECVHEGCTNRISALDDQFWCGKHGGETLEIQHGDTEVKRWSWNRVEGPVQIETGGFVAYPDFATVAAERNELSAKVDRLTARGFEDLHHENDQLRAENAALREEKDMLDWLEKRMHVTFTDDGESVYCVSIPMHECPDPKDANLRTATKAAREGE